MLLIILLLLLTDLLFYRGILHLINNKTDKQKKILTLLFWLHSIILLGGTLLAFRWMKNDSDPAIQKRMYMYAGILISFYLPKLIFIPFNIIESILNTCFRALKKAFKGVRSAEKEDDHKISRVTFISKTGLILSALPFASFLFGMTSVKFKFRIEKIHLQFKDLPDKFSGLRIVQISDLHLGSLYGQQRHIERAVDQINSLSPDLVFFTGDLVNDFASEIDGWYNVLGKIESKLGKFSILGNHDYGDYHFWESDSEKRNNLEKIKKAHKKLGFKLLLNEYEIITIKNESIAIIGVENWGEPPFAQYGNINKACSGTENIPFKILLTHDPSHWDAEILKKRDLPLTFSGHTHGMQVGIRAKNMKWSPAKIKYPRWIGLYKEGNQYLYVNPGLGYIGYPGRVGISPEITFTEIKKGCSNIETARI